MTEIKEMLDIVWGLTVRAISVNLQNFIIFMFTAQKYHYKANLLMSKSIVRRLVPSNACCL